MGEPSRVVAVGCKAWGALRASNGQVSAFAEVGDAWYLEAGSEIVWATHGGTLPHPRALVIAEPLPANWPGGYLAPGDAPVGRPAFPARLAGGRRFMEARAQALTSALAQSEAPRGMGRLLLGEEPDFPLGEARGAAAGLSRAVRAGEPDAARKAAIALIGLGPGLTPAGDDYVCGTLLAAHLLAAADPATNAFLAAMRAAIAGAAAKRTSRISAALLADAAEGLSFEALHALCNALASGDDAAGRVAAHRLAGIGNSSGWDMLAGLLGVLAGLPGD